MNSAGGFASGFPMHASGHSAPGLVAMLPGIPDFDTCVVLKRADEEANRWIRSVAWEMGFENERVITTFILDDEQFEEGPMSESTLVGHILQEGVAS